MGHRAFECPLPLTTKGGGSQEKEGNKISPRERSQCSSEQNRPKHKNRPELKSLHDCYHNPNPIARLIGKRNESPVIVDGVEYPGLLDSGAQILTITISQAKKMGLEIQNLESLLDIEGGGGIAIPYIGYVEVNLQIPEIKNYNEDALMMVMNDSRYGKKVPFAIGTIHIHAALKAMTKDEWDNMTLSWQSVVLPACAFKLQGGETSV